MVTSPPSACFPLCLCLFLCSSLLFLPASGTVNVVGLPYNNGRVRAFHSDHTAVSPPSGIAGRVAAQLYTQINHLLPYFTSRRELAVKEGVTLPMPTIITVPATNPATITPTNPTNTLPIPSVTPPIIVPPANPAGGGGISPVPVTNPTTTPSPPAATIPGAGAGGQQPVTNPATTYSPPAAAGGGTPPAVTNPVAPPAGGGNTGNAPAVPGQSWCVAKSGASAAALQAALDYACGMGGADCSQIQQGSGCYNPNSLQNHASFAFNSYYQKNPTATSCDFGGTAVVVSSNPSSGTCVYPSSSSSSSTPSSSSSPPATSSGISPLTPSVPSPSTSSANPVTTNSSPPAGMGTTGTTVTPPSVLNSSSPGGSTATIIGSDVPPGVNPSPMDGSNSVVSKPFLGCVVLAVSFIAGMMVLDM